MDIEPRTTILIFGVAALVFGTYSFILGKLVFYPGEEERRSKTLVGMKARLVGVIMLIASLFLLIGNAYGFLILGLAIMLPIVMSNINHRKL